MAIVVAVPRQSSARGPLHYVSINPCFLRSHSAHINSIANRQLWPLMVRRKLSKGINLSEIELRKENENRQKVCYLKSWDTRLSILLIDQVLSIDLWHKHGFLLGPKKIFLSIHQTFVLLPVTWFDQKPFFKTLKNSFFMSPIHQIFNTLISV